MSDLDIESVIADSITDAISEPVDDSSTSLSNTGDSSAGVADLTTPDAEPALFSDTSAETPTDDNIAVSTPASQQAVPAEVEDKFAKEHGLPPQLPGSRENRIPYSRVKAIVAKAEQKALTPVQAKVTEYEAKVKDYEGRLAQVGQFEEIMTKNPDQFLQMLSTLPAYKQFFSAVSQAVETATRLSQAQGSQPPTTQAQPDPASDMPQPTETLPDGTKVYSMDGLKALMAWQAKQVEDRITSQVQQRYAPIEQAWRTQEQLNQLVPVVQRQIDEARQWPLFNEHEAEITKALQSNLKLSLPEAYQQVVLPKLAVSRDQMREAILKEIKSRPAASTSVPASVTRTSPVKPANRSLEQIIQDSISQLR